MVFPIEAEHRAKRRALRLCQDHLLKVIEVFRNTVQLMDAFRNDEKSSLKQLYLEVQTLGDGVDDSKRFVAQELVEIGAILTNREDFLRFTDVISEVADFCKGIAFRILKITEHGWEVPLDLKKEIMNLATAVLDTVSKLRETFLMLNYGSPKVLRKAKDVEIAETYVDKIYRELEIDILDEKLNINILLLLRDIVQLLEETADKVEDTSDATRILAFAI